MTRLSFVVYSRSPETRTRVVEQLLATDLVTVSATLADLQGLHDTLRSHRADGIYLDLDEDPHDTLSSVASLPEPRPTLLLGARAGDAPLLLQAMRLGAKDFYLGHKLVGVENALETVAPVRSLSDRPAPTLAVVGAKGGVGATTIACELGVALQEAGLRTIVVDLSRRLGDVALYFDLNPRYDITDIVRHDGELDAVFIDAVLSSHESQVSVLASPSKLEDVTLLGTSKLDRVLKLLQSEFDCIILDSPWDFDEFSLRALDMSNEILLVTTPDVTSLTHARTRRQMVERFGALPERVHLVLNRASADASIDKKQVVDFLERELDSVIPDAREAARKCTDEGVILRDVPEGRAMRQSILALRDQVCEWCQFELPEDEGVASRTKLMSRLRHLVRRK
jgi:pilus assembly protein CpaE